MVVKSRTGSQKVNQLVAEARREKERREKGYRERAFKLFPKLCAHCGREFSGKRLKELTVHHKDHNHDNNPPDGSNWELLCIYCHDNEHSRLEVAEAYDGFAAEDDPGPSASGNMPFADLAALLQKKK